MSNPLGIQGPKRTTMQRLQRFFVGASHGCRSHRGKETGLGGNSKRTIDASLQRLADRCDCEHYDECLDVAAHANKRCVCKWPCGRFAPRAVDMEIQRTTNFPSEDEIGMVLG